VAGVRAANAGEQADQLLLLEAVLYACVRAGRIRLAGGKFCVDVCSPVCTLSADMARCRRQRRSTATQHNAAAERPLAAQNTREPACGHASAGERGEQADQLLLLAVLCAMSRRLQ
jgi:hypothetical protein